MMKTRRVYFTFLTLTLTLIAMTFLLSPQTSGQQDTSARQDLIGQCRAYCRQQYKTCKDAANADKEQCKQAYNTCRDSCKDARWQVLNNGSTGANTSVVIMNTNANITRNTNTNGNMNRNTNGNMNRNTNTNGNMNRNTNNTNSNTNRP
jgi:hypothetical protein